MGRCAAGDGAFCNGHVLLCDGEEHEFAESVLHMVNLVID